MTYGLTDSTIQKITNVLSGFEEVQEAIIYGSRVKGNFRPGSDIDLAFKGDQLNSTIVGKIDEQLDDLLLPYIFDLSIYHHISNTALLEHIDRIGQKLYCSRQ